MTTKPSSSSQVQVEVVGEDGVTMEQRPINIDDLLRQKDHKMKINDDVTLHLEEFDPNANYDEEEFDEESESSSEDSSSDDVVAARVRAPPGTEQTSDWYQVLNELRKEHDEMSAKQKAERQRGKESSSGGQLVRRRSSSHPRSAATPLKRFRTPRDEDDTKVPKKSFASGDVAKAKEMAKKFANMSRHDVWASMAPPLPQPERNYHRLQYVSVMPQNDPRRFRPPALTFHAMASYTNSSDMCQRVLVYGGVGVGSRHVEQELYEYCLLTLNWRRVEGRQFVPAGHYGHAMVVVEAMDKLVVIGGIGPGGPLTLQDSVLEADPLRASRAKHLLPLGCRIQTKRSGQTASAEQPFTRLGSKAKSSTTVGFVPYLFDMDLSTQTWRAIQTQVIFPLAYHTAVSFGNEVFVFGGLTDQLEVSGQLIAVDVSTYTVRVIRPAKSRHAAAGEGKDASSHGEVPEARFLHSAVRYGNYMIVFGGLDAKNEPTSDVWAFDLVNERWERLPCRGEVIGRAGHAATVVGCRMLITGGLQTSLEESTDAQEAVAPTVMELNLVPTTKGEHLWSERVRTKPALPPLLFSTAAACGDEASYVVFGGLTKKSKASAKKDAKEKAAASRAASPSSHKREPKPGANEDDANAEATAEETNVLMRKLILFDDSVVMTFAAKAAKKGEDGEEEKEPHVNELGIEVDPDELPEHFKAFVRRQEDFVKKKEVEAHTTAKKITLEERESMEPTLYLTEEEIAKLMEKSEQVCAAFVQEYKIDDLPSNVPDRETRIHIIEECISLSRQARDIIKSMKGSEAGVTAVKSKTHRKRAGQKFEDYSAAKPFRRTVVDHLIQGINHQLAHMHQLNRALRTVDWEEKEGFVTAIGNMQTTVNALNKTIAHIMNRYIKNRVDSLMKGVDKHKEVMRLLTEVVERNRRDKIFGRDTAPDKQRERVKQMWAKGEAAAGKEAGGKLRPKRASPKPSSRTASAPPRNSLGAGFYADESAASITVSSREWNQLMEQTKKIEISVNRLSHHCQEGMTNVPSSLPQQALQPPSTTGGPPPMAFGGPPTVTVPGQPVLPPPTGFAPIPQVTVAEAPTGGDAGTASTKELIVRHSNALREKTISLSAEVAQAAQAFRDVLIRRDEDAAAGAVTTTAKDAGKAVRGSRTDTATVTTTSTSTGPAAQALPSPPVVVTAPGNAFAPPPLASAPSGLRPPVTAGISPPGLATPPAPFTAEQPASLPPQPSAPNAGIPPAEPEDSLKTHTVYLSSLRPLIELKDKLEKFKSKVALIRCNEWDTSNTAGAPQDVTAEKLYTRLLGSVSGVVQRITSSFLSKAGARKPYSAARNRSVQPPPPPRGTSASRKSKPAAPGTGPAPRAPSNTHTKTTRSGRHSSATRKSSGHTRRTKSTSRSGPTATAQGRNTRTASGSSNGSSYYNSSYYYYDSSRSSSRGVDTIVPHTEIDRSSALSENIGSLPPQSGVTPSVPLQRGVKALPRPRDENVAAAPAPAKRAGNSKVQVSVPAAKRPSSPKTKGLLGTLSYDITAHTVDLAQLPAPGTAYAQQQQQQQQQAGATSAFLQPVPLVPPEAMVTRTPPPSAAGGLATATPPPLVCEVEPAGVSAVTKVPNVSPGGGASSVAPHVDLMGGIRPSYANDWAVAGARRNMLYDAVAYQMGAPQAATATTVASPPPPPPQPPAESGAVSLAVGSVVHIPPSITDSSAGNNAQKPRRSTILALTQIGGGDEGEEDLAPMTSVAPGPFVVNAEHFYNEVPLVDPAAPGAPAPAPTTGATSWADAEEDYFYFGRGERKARPLPSAVTPPPAPAAAASAAATAVRSSTRQYPSYHVSPPVGTALASQHVNAQRRTASKNKATRPIPATARPTASSEAKTRRPNTAGALDPHSHLTPGERRILEARERLSRKAK